MEELLYLHSYSRQIAHLCCYLHMMLFLGLFSTPTNLTAIENGVGSLRISWLFSCVEGVEFEYILTATNINISNARPIVQVLQEQHYIFTLENSLCDVYAFQVRALNATWSSNLSEILTRSLPSLPDVSAIEATLEQSLIKIAVIKSVTLILMFQART